MIIKKGIRYFKKHGVRKTLARSFLELKLIQKEGFNYFLKKADQQNGISTVFFDDDSYRLWTERNEPNTFVLHNQRKISKKFKLKPKISVITPVYNPDKNVFIDMIESVFKQTYENWELCMADASSESYVRDVIESYRNNYDENIKVKYLEKNYGIARNSNEALSLATGDFVALLDHDDMIAPFALFEVVKTINEYPDVDFIYSDRDIISEDGKRIYPFFKPDWSPDYLLSQNYLCHLNVFKKTLIDRIKGFREGYDGSQDYDLLLRVTELTDNIVHIPKILYHWRRVIGSAASDQDAKPYAYVAAIKALQDAVDRRGWKGVVTQGKEQWLYRIRFQINGNPKVSIIIPTKDKIQMLKKCVSSIIHKTTYKNYEIVIVDNKGLETKSFEYQRELERIPEIKLLSYNEPFNFSRTNNYAVSQVDSEYILFLNNDVEVITGDWLEVLLGFAQRKETGAVGAKLIYPDETIHHSGFILDENGNVRRSHHRYPKNNLGNGFGGRMQSIQNVSAVAAECMMVRRKVFDEVGGFDPKFVAYGDIDFCLKLREKGYLIVYEPHAELYFHESPKLGYDDKSVESEALSKEKDLFLKRWRHILKKGDPYYSPNLTTAKEDFSIRI